MSKISGDEGCHSKNAVPRHGVFAMTDPRMLIFAYTSFHAFVVHHLFSQNIKLQWVSLLLETKNNLQPCGLRLLGL
jgi:hypothetical protein